MRIRNTWLVWLLLAALGPVASQASQVSVSEGGVGTDVVDRVLQGTDVKFDASVGRLYAYTRIVGAENETQVSHRWYYNDHLMAEVTLPIRGADWRTWSSKNLVPMWIGSWRVDVVDMQGSVLESMAFQVE